jgi:hypothetical protein
MAQPKPYKHYLRYYDISASAYEYYYVTGTTVDNTSAKTELARAPEGWQEYEVGWERGFTYYGMFTSYATPLKFHKDGALILRYLQYTYGIEAKCELLVEKFNSDTAVFDYETFFIGDLDLSKATDEFDYVVVPIMESGFPAKLKAREDTPYEFAIDGNTDVKFVYSDGLNLQAKLSWAGLPNTSINGYYNPSLVSYDHEGTNLYLQQYDHLLSGNSPFILLANNSNISQDIDFVYDYSITIHLDNSVAASSYFWIQFREVVISTNTFVSNTYILNSTYLHAPNLTYTYIGTIQLPYTLSPNRRIEVTYRMWQPVAAAFLISGTDYQLTSNYEEVTAYFVNRYEPSYIQTLRAVDVMQYLIDEIGKNSLGQPDQTPAFIDHTIESQFPNQIVITSGDGLRNLGGSKLKISFSELFKFLNTKFGVAFYYDKTTNTCHLQDKSNVFINSQGVGYGNIGSVKNLKITPFTSEAFVNLKIGDKKQSYDQRGANDTEITNGKDEFNTETVRLSPLVRINATADYISPIRCDMYGIEFVRVNLESKTLADSSTDNDVFAIHKNEDSSGNFNRYVSGTGYVSTPYYLLYRTPIVSGTWEIQNIFSPETAYNILFSPQRSLFRNGAYFRSLLKLNDANSLNFQLSGMNNVGNLKMITYTNGALDFNEGGAVLISDLCPDEDLLFKPIIFEFETKEVINLYNLIEDNPYNYITFTYLDNQYAGFIISAKSKPVIRGTTQFKLLAAPNTTLTNLIR